MSDQRTKRRQRQPIDIGGEVLEPRADFAKNTLQVSDRTAKRMNLPTVYVGNVAHVARNASLKLVASRDPAGQPPRRSSSKAP